MHQELSVHPSVLSLADLQAEKALISSVCNTKLHMFCTVHSFIMFCTVHRWISLPTYRNTIAGIYNRSVIPQSY